MNKWIYTIVMVFAIAVLSAVNFHVNVFASTQVGGQSNGYSCDGSATNRWKTTNEGENTVTLPVGNTIATIDVKAGDNCVPVYPTNTASTCYSVVVNGNTATVTKIGSGPSCKDISHLEGTYSVTPTPTLTSVPTATSTPTNAPTATPTVTTPTPTPTTDPCANNACVTPGQPTDTPTPTVVVTDTPTPGPTNTPTPVATDTPTPCTNNCGSNNNNNNSTPSNPTQAVLGASTMASTGVFEDTVMNLMTVLGMISLGAGATKYVKTKKS